MRSSRRHRAGGRRCLRASHPNRGRMARVLHAAWWPACCLAGRRIQAHTEERRQARESAGGPAGLREETKTSTRNKVDELPAFDAAPYLDCDEAIASYLTDILQANDAGLLSAALGDIARARGMTDIAKAAGITREALYKALRPGSAPRFDTVNRVCTALGVRLVVQPLRPVR